MILQDILNNNIPSTVDFQNLNLQADVYQVVIYEKYSHHASKMTYRFSELLKVTNTDNSSYENITLDDNEILILKGPFTIKKFEEFL